jgi:hypothetical protein
MLNILRRFVIFGLPEEPSPRVNAMFFISNGAFFGVPHTGSKKEWL